MNQLMIGITGVVAIYLSQHKSDNIRKYACLFGLAGQPFWFYSAYKADQWGIFILCIMYTISWITGIKNNWFNK